MKRWLRQRTVSESQYSHTRLFCLINSLSMTLWLCLSSIIIWSDCDWIWIWLIIWLSDYLSVFAFAWWSQFYHQQTADAKPPNWKESNTSTSAALQAGSPDDVAACVSLHHCIILSVKNSSASSALQGEGMHSGCQQARRGDSTTVTSHRVSLVILSRCKQDTT